MDPASYLVEGELEVARAAQSLDPAINEETQFPSGQLLRRLESTLGPPGRRWSFRVLNGDPAKALSRLADSTGASLIIVGGPRPEITARMSRLLEGSVSALLIRHQKRPILVIPDSE